MNSGISLKQKIARKQVFAVPAHGLFLIAVEYPANYLGESL